MTREEFLDLLARLQRASAGHVRAPHKPLLLLWLFGRFAATGSTVAAYSEAEGPVSALINDFGPHEELVPGTFYAAEITESHDYDVVARIIE